MLKIESAARLDLQLGKYEHSLDEQPVFYRVIRVMLNSHRQTKQFYRVGSGSVNWT